MRAFGLMVVLSVLFAGCEFNAARCEADGGCPNGATCAASGFCYANSGGGTAGGDSGTTGGGGGGGTSGGGTGGGGNLGGGTGGGGGGTPACDFAQCVVGERCGATACEAPELAIVFTVAPPVVGAGGTPATGQIQLVDGGSATGVRMPAAVAVAVPSGLSVAPSSMVAVNGSSFDFTLTAGPQAAIPSAMVSASFPTAAQGQVRGSFTTRVDGVGPMLSFEPLDAGIRRDDRIVVTLVSNEALNPATVQVKLKNLPLVPVDGGCPLCFTADFSLPTMNSLTDSFMLTATASDIAGNAGTAGGIDVPVTRIRWTKLVTGIDLRAAPAIGPDGTVYVGMTNSQSTAGRLSALEPDTGTEVNTRTDLGAIVSVAVSPSTTSVNVTSSGTVLFVASNSARGEVRGVSGSLSDTVAGQLLSSAAVAGGSNKVWSGLALNRSSNTTPSAVSAIATTSSAASTPARILKWDSIDAPVASNLPQSATLGSPLEPLEVGASVRTAVGVVVSQNTARFLTLQPMGAAAIPSTGLFLRNVTGVSTTPTLDTGILLDGSDTAFASGQALISTGALVGSFTGSRKLQLVGGTATPFTPAGAVDYGVPVVAETGAAGYGFVGAGDAIVRFDPPPLMTPGTIVAQLGSTAVRTSPVLGKATAGRPALGYAVTTTGTLVVFDASSSGVAGSAWTGTVSGISSNVITHPGFDCNRRAGAAKSTTGLLYIPYQDGNVAAIIVDSPALMDGAGAWPKYQRSSGNAGNDDTAFFPTNWTCP